MADAPSKPRSAKALKPIVHNHRISEQDTRPPLTSIGTVTPIITYNSKDQIRSVHYPAPVTGTRARSVSEPVTYQGHFVPKYGYQIPEIRPDFWKLPKDKLESRIDEIDWSKCNLNDPDDLTSQMRKCGLSNDQRTLVALSAGARKCSIQCSPRLLDPKPWGIINTADSKTQSESDFIIHPKDTFGLMSESVFMVACNKRCSFEMEYSEIADTIVSYCISEKHTINAELKAMRSKVKKYQLEELNKLSNDELIDIVEEVQRRDSMNPSQPTPRTTSSVPVPSQTTMKSAVTVQSTTNSPSPLSQVITNNTEEEEDDQRRGRRQSSSKWSRGSIDERESMTAKEVQESKSRSRIRELWRRSKSRHNSSSCSGAGSSFRRSFGNLNNKRSSSNDLSHDTDDIPNQGTTNGNSNLEMDVLNTALEGIKNPYVPTIECRGLERLIDALMKAD